MLATGLNFACRPGEDRFYNPAKSRQSFHGVDSVNREPENLVGSDEAKKVVAVPSCEPEVKRLGNLEQFLQAITPSAPAQYLSKSTMKRIRTCNVEFQPYFVLGDLWESFRERKEETRKR